MTSLLKAKKSLNRQSNCAPKRAKQGQAERKEKKKCVQIDFRSCRWWHESRKVH